MEVKLETLAGNEVCDDCNTANKDGCSCDCLTEEEGWTCTTSPWGLSVCEEDCGDGRSSESALECSFSTNADPDHGTDSVRFRKYSGTSTTDKHDKDDDDKGDASGNCELGDSGSTDDCASGLIILDEDDDNEYDDPHIDVAIPLNKRDRLDLTRANHSLPHAEAVSSLFERTSAMSVETELHAQYGLNLANLKDNSPGCVNKEEMIYAPQDSSTGHLGAAIMFPEVRADLANGPRATKCLAELKTLKLHKGKMDGASHAAANVEGYMNVTSRYRTDGTANIIWHQPPSSLAENVDDNIETMTYDTLFDSEVCLPTRSWGVAYLHHAFACARCVCGCLRWCASPRSSLINTT